MLLYSVNLMPISAFMKHLLSVYGNMTVYLDATLNVCDYADILFLFWLSEPTACFRYYYELATYIAPLVLFYSFASANEYI